jgi:hypothetical protein
MKKNIINKGDPGLPWIPKEFGRRPQRDDLACESGIAQRKLCREKPEQHRRTMNLERMDAREETAGATAS